MAKRANGEGSISRHHTARCDGKVDKKGQPACSCGWRARATVTVQGERQRRTLYGKSHAEVLGKLKGLAVEEATHKLVARTMTVQAWAELWLKECEKTLKPNTVKGYRSVVDTKIVPMLGKHRLDRLEPHHVSLAYQKLRDRGLAEGTVRGMHVLLHRLLVLAMREGLVSRNVTEMVQPPATNTAVARRGLTVDEAKAVLTLAGADPRYWLALLCGLRQGEALALRWCDLYLDGPQPHLVVRQAVSAVKGGGLHYDEPKSRQSKDRVVPLPVEVAVRLRAAKAKAVAAGRTEQGDPTPGVYGPQGLVFVNRVGRGRDMRKDWLGWTLLLEAAGIDHTPLHAARNTAAMLLEDAGNAPRVVAELLGHTQVAMTYRYQAGNVPAKVAAMGRLDVLMAAPATDEERVA